VIKRNNQYFLGAFALLLGAGLLVNRLEAAVPVQLMHSLGALPVEVGDYSGREALAEERNYQAESADSSVYRTYVEGVGAQSVQVYVGYWESQSENKRVKLPRYVPEGWGYYWFRQKQLVSPASGEMSFNEFLNEGRRRKELVYYSFIVNGRILNSEYRLRVMNMWNSLRHRRNNAAVVRVSSFLRQNESVESAEKRIENFLHRFMPALMIHLPG